MPDLRQRFRKKNPDFPLLELTEPALVEDHLRALGWLDDDDLFLGCSRAGDGNMNLTLRIHKQDGSVIVKQSRPWVEKYDQIKAPFDRALVEKAFYERVAEIPGVSRRMPKLIAADAASRCLLFEDLGECEDCTSLYAGEQLEESHVDHLADYLEELHTETRGSDGSQLRNREMRALNHAHIFVIPLTPREGIEDLEQYETGLAYIAESLWQDSKFLRATQEVGERYLADGECLVHGDYFPGSWLRDPNDQERLFVIDPEFAHFGDAAFDYGVALAHLFLSGQSDEVVGSWAEMATGRCDAELLSRYSGIEVMRRLIGVAQLPIEKTVGERTDSLCRARTVVVEGDWERWFDDMPDMDWWA